MEEKRIVIIGILENTYDISSRIYEISGISPTISARDYKGPIKVLVYGSKSNRTDG